MAPTTPLDVLMACAFEGERVGAGSAHGDNIAPAVYGGFVLVRVADPADVIRLPVPAGLTAVVVHPDLEIETARARELLGQTVALGDAIRQWANLGTLVDALHRADFEQLARSLEDTIAEPRRAPLVPGLAEIKRAAVDAGALGCSLSGSGPSLFALCRDASAAARVAAAMTAAVRHAHRRRRPRPTFRPSLHAARAWYSSSHLRFVTTTGSAPPVSFTTALFDGLAPDGGLYVPERIEPWTRGRTRAAAAAHADRDRLARDASLHPRRARSRPSSKPSSSRR